MKLGIMQPYFFPYIGYFSLINYCDKFVFFDTPQYIRKGWVNRNRFVRADGQVDYFTVPVEKCARETPINQVMIDNALPWKEKIYGQFTAYKKRAPFYNQVVELLRDVLETDVKISDLSIESIVKASEYIGIDTSFETFSTMDLAIGEVQEADEWALQITKAMQYPIYVNPPGGKEFFHKEKYTNAGIELQFLAPELKQYNQKRGHFEPGLSIIDLMMFLSPEEIREMLKYYVIS